MKIKIFSSAYNLGDSLKLPIIVHGNFAPNKNMVRVMGYELTKHGAEFIKPMNVYPFYIGQECEVLDEN